MNFWNFGKDIKFFQVSFFHILEESWKIPQKARKNPPSYSSCLLKINREMIITKLEVLYKKAVHKSFAIFTCKHLCWSLFLVSFFKKFFKKGWLITSRWLVSVLYPCSMKKFDLFFRTSVLEHRINNTLMYKAETATISLCHYVLFKKLFLKFLQSSQENTYVRVSFTKRY